jgi:DNA ligase-1
MAAPPKDAAWALTFLTGRSLKRSVATPRLREWMAEAAHLPLWLVEECYEAVGDLAETLALLLPPAGSPLEQPLHQVVEETLLPLARMKDPERREHLLNVWSRLGTAQRLVWNKLMTGAFRVGASRALVSRGIAEAANVPASQITHRLMGSWSPTEADYLRLIADTPELIDFAQPYPFFLAHPIEGSVENLGEPADWQAEWKWDGIRGQLIRRNAQAWLWSRGEEIVTDRFPEIAAMAEHLPEGTVVDGEILAWKNNQPLPFGNLQHRIMLKKKVSAELLEDCPVTFMAYDLLELDGEDYRSKPLEIRRAALEILPLTLSPVHPYRTWDELKHYFGQARERGVEGLMLKRHASPYRTGRTKGDWWKWKVDPHHVDAVLMYAQAGHGRRASLCTDYTFGVWKGDQLVPIAKAYSGLTDEEIRSVDGFIRRHTTEKFGPVRVVKPELVFELAFEGIQRSTRHKSGIALRFPRMSRMRQDKPAAEADRLETLAAMLSTPTA